MTSKSSKLFSCVDHSPESGSVFKSVVWSDDFVEIICKQPSTERSKTCRVSSALVSAMIQQYYFDLDVLWKELCECVQFYSDSILFSTQHAFYYPIIRDNKGKSAYKIYQMSKFVDGEPESWLIEFFTNTDYPFDLEIAVKRSMFWDQWYYYRIEAPFLKPYFEKYCLEMFAKSKKSVTTNFIADSLSAQSNKLQQAIVSNNSVTQNISETNLISTDKVAMSNRNDSEEKEKDRPPKPNYMLEAIADELIFDEDTSKLLVKSIEILKLQDYLDQSLRSYKDRDHRSNLVSDDEDENSDKFSHLSPLNSPEHHFIKINDISTQQNTPTPRTTTLHLHSSSPQHLDDDNQSVATATDRSQLAAMTLGELPEQRPPPIEKYSQSINISQENEHFSFSPHIHHVSFATDGTSSKNTKLEIDSSKNSRNNRITVSEKIRHGGDPTNLVVVPEDVIEVPTLISPKVLPMNPDGIREQTISDNHITEPTPRFTATNISPLMARIAKDLNISRVREYINISELMENAHSQQAATIILAEDGHEIHHSDLPLGETLYTSPDIRSSQAESNQQDQQQSHGLAANDPHAPPKLTVTQQLALIEKQPVAPFTPRKVTTRSTDEFHSPEEDLPVTSEDISRNKQANNRLLATRRSRSNGAANASTAANTRESSKQAQLRKEFLQSHNPKNAFVYESNIEKVQDQITQMVEDNKLLILKAKQEADLLMRSPLNQQGAMLLNKAQTVNASSAHSEGISNEMKMAIVRDALSLRPDLRSAVSTKAIVEFLQAHCPSLGVHMKLSSWDDLVAISHGASLVEVRKMDPKYTKEEEETGAALDNSSLRMDKVKGQDLSGILGIQKGQIIANLYVVLQGSITVEWQEEDNEAKLKELFRGRNTSKLYDDNNEDEDPDEDDDDEDDDNGDNDDNNKDIQEQRMTTRSMPLNKQFSGDVRPTAKPAISGNLPSFVRQHTNHGRTASSPPTKGPRNREISNRSAQQHINKKRESDSDDDDDDNDSEHSGNYESLHTLPADNDQSTAVTTIRTMETSYAPQNKNIDSSNNNYNNDNNEVTNGNKPRNPWGVASLNQFKMSSTRNIDVEEIVVSAKKKQKPHYALAKSDRSHHSNNSNGSGSASKDSHNQRKSSKQSQQMQSGYKLDESGGSRKNLVTRRQVLVNGSVIGENVFRGEYLYTYDVVHYSPDAQVCQIPVIAFEHFVGRSGKDVEEYLVHFWKRLRLWILIKEYNKALVQQNLYEIKFKQIMAHGGANRRDHRQPKAQVMNVIDSGRIRTYHAGEVVFEQDTPRHYMYIIKQGITKYYREFQPKSIASINGKDIDEMSWLKDIVPPRVETTIFYNALDDALKKKAFTSTKISPRPTSSGYGNQPFQEKNPTKKADNHRSSNATNTDLPKVDPWEEPHVNPGAEDHGGGILLTHDFSFLDSEQAELFLPHMVEMDKKFLGHVGNEDEEVDEEGEMLLSPEAARERKLKKQLNALYQESERAQEYRRQKYARFDRHRNTLIATTRCEICVIQLSEIVKCYPLFQTLFKLANDRYPGLLVSNEQVVRNYHYQQEWLRQRPILLQEVAQEQLNKLLYEEIHHDLGNYENEQLYDSRKPGLQHLRVQGKMASVQRRQWELQQGETEKSQLLLAAATAATAKDTDTKPSSPKTHRSSSPPLLSLEEPVPNGINNNNNHDSFMCSQMSSKFSSPPRSLASSPLMKRPTSPSVEANSRRHSYQSKRDSFSTRDAETIATSIKSSVSDELLPDAAYVMDFGYKQILNNSIRMFGGKKRGQNKSSPENRQLSLFSVDSLASSVPVDRSVGKSQDSTQTQQLPSWSLPDTSNANYTNAKNQSDDLMSTKSDANSNHSKSSVSHHLLESIREEDKDKSQPLKIDPAWIAYAAKQHEAFIAKQEVATTHRPFSETYCQVKAQHHVAGETHSLGKKKKKKVPQLQFPNDNVPQQLKALSEMDFSGASPTPSSATAHSAMEIIRSVEDNRTANTSTAFGVEKQTTSTSKRPYSASASTVRRNTKVGQQITADVEHLPVTYTTEAGPPVKISTAVGIDNGLNLLAPHRPTQSRPSSANASVRGTSHRTFLKQQQQQSHVQPESMSQAERSVSPPIGSDRAPRGKSRVDPMSGRPISSGRPRSAAAVNAPTKLRPEDYADLYRAHMGGQLSGRSSIGQHQHHHHDLSSDLAVLRAQDREKVNQIRIRHESLLIQQEQYDLKRLAAESRAEESSEEEDDEEGDTGSQCNHMDDSSTVRSGGRQSVRSGQSRGSTVSRGSVGGNSSGSSRRGGSIRDSASAGGGRSGGSVGLNNARNNNMDSNGNLVRPRGNGGSVSNRQSTSRGDGGSVSFIAATESAGSKKNSTIVSSTLAPRNPSIAAAATGVGGVGLNPAPKYLDDFFRRFQS